jgi:DNA polymerase-3 subunit epsilon
MLNELFSLTRPLFVIDVETTGLDVQADRIIELGFQRWEAAGMTKEWRTFVNPGQPISAASHAVHHITDEDVKTAYTFQQLAANLAKGFTSCDFAGKNVRFDLRILAAEMLRVKQPWHYADARIIDADRLEQLGEPRHLSDLYKKHTGKDLIAAHAALNDVRATTETLAAQLIKYAALPRDLDQLHAAQWPGFIDSEGRFRILNGVPVINFGKWRGTAMRAVERSYWTWMGGPKTDFSDEIKAIARAAAAGVFPGQRTPQETP